LKKFAEHIVRLAKEKDRRRSKGRRCTGGRLCYSAPFED
jgi:hypothetical protein